SGRRAVRASLHHEIGLGGVVDGPGGTWRLSVSPSRSSGDDERDGLTAWRARFDAEALVLPLVVRSVEPGDRIDIPGVGTRKLQDVFVDAKVPRERRGSVPLVLDATGRILWVPGVVRGGAARVTDVTTRVVDMELRDVQ